MIIVGCEDHWMFFLMNNNYLMWQKLCDTKKNPNAFPWFFVKYVTKWGVMSQKVNKGRFLKFLKMF